MSLTIEELVDNYQRRTDAELKDLATRSAADLSPQALTALDHVLKARGIADEVRSAIEVQKAPLDEKKVMAFVELVRHLPCPFCGGTGQPLNASVSGKVVSVVVFTNYEKQLNLGCPDCLDKKNDNATNTSLAAGWWGIPWGPIHTVQALNLNAKSKTEHRAGKPTPELIGFVVGNMGRIEAIKEDEKALRRLLADAQQ